jgi:transcriptional regulator with XRE-family HTH domain
LAFFGSEVRRARLDARMSLAELAALVPCDASTVSRYESAELAPDRAFAVVCDATFPGAGGWFTRFYDAHLTWGTSPFPPGYESFADDEARASALYLAEHSILPGLFQTEAYARAVLSRHPNVTSALVAARVAVRIARQAVLDRDDPPLVWAVIDDAALTRCVGSPEVTRDALAKLARIARRQRVTVQVMEGADYHVGQQGGFAIAEVAGRAGSVAIEDIIDGRVTDAVPSVREASVRFRWLQAEAMPVAASLARIDQRAEQWQDRAPKDGGKRLTAVPAAETAQKLGS